MGRARLIIRLLEWSCIGGPGLFKSVPVPMRRRGRHWDSSNAVFLGEELTICMTLPILQHSTHTITSFEARFMAGLVNIRR